MKAPTIRTVDAGATGFGRGVVRIPGPVVQRRGAGAVDDGTHKVAVATPLTEDDYEYLASVEAEILERRRSGNR